MGCILPKFKSVMAELDRVLKDDAHVYVFTRWDKIPDFYPVINEKFPVKNMIIVNKNNWSMGNLFGAYANKYETILFGSKKNKHLNCIGDICRHADVIDVKRVSGAEQVHSHQKPEALIDFLIEKSSKPGDVVIDPFAGSGTTCASAIKRGRRCIGIDIDAGAVAIARARVRRVLDRQS
jgi:DNA modification methylase